MFSNDIPSPDPLREHSVAAKAELPKQLAEEALLLELHYLSSSVGQYRPMDFLQELKNTDLASEKGVYEGNLIDSIRKSNQVNKASEGNSERHLLVKILSPVTEAIDSACDHLDASEVLKSLRDRGLVSVVTSYTTVSAAGMMNGMDLGPSTPNTTITSNDYYITQHGKRLLELVSDISAAPGVSSNLARISIERCRPLSDREARREFPNLPSLDSPSRLGINAHKILETLNGYLSEGTKAYRDYLLATDPNLPKISTEALMALAVCHKYGAIYWVNPFEAANHLAALQRENSDSLEKWKQLITQPETEKIFNRAVSLFLLDGREDGIVCPASFKLPHGSLYSVSPREILVNKQNLEFAEKASAEWIAGSRYDLHDFAHMICTHVESELYGNKYSGVFAELPPDFQQLVRSKHIGTEQALPFSDGLVFSYLSMPPFQAAESRERSDLEIVQEVALQLRDYFLGKKALYHPKIEQWLLPSRPVLPSELAVLVQNKCYEHSASEIEKAVFTRGNHRGDDELTGLSPEELLEKLVHNHYTDYDRRNYLRHRAHKLALRLTATELLCKPESTSEDRQILSMIIDNADFTDFKTGQRNNLFEYAKKWCDEGNSLPGKYHSFRSFHIVNNNPNSKMLIRTRDIWTDKELEREFVKFISSESDGLEVESAICALTRFALEQNQISLDNRIILAPLRACLPVLAQLRESLPNAPVVFISKGNSFSQEVEQLKRQYPERKYIIADTILATGQTLDRIIETMKQTGIQESDIAVLACYAAPEGITRLEDKHPGLSTFTAVLSETVDTDGFLIPYTNGDLGDKLFNIL